MSQSREFLEMQIRAFGERPFTRFMLDHGKDYAVGLKTYAGPRGEPGLCYMNAAHLAFDSQLHCRDITYVEGTIYCYGVPIEHAWCVDNNGIVIDPTLKPDENIGQYYGVPFLTNYVRKAVIRNGIYGLLDVYHARKTAPKLIELGLEAGQQWLLDQKKAKRKARA